MKRLWVAIVVCAGIFGGCSSKPVERTWLSMGTFAAVSLSGNDAQRIDEAEQLVFKEFTRLEGLWSNYNTNSEVSRLSSSPEPIRVSAETIELLSAAARFSRMTDGCFDSTVGPLVELWGIGRNREFVVPSDDQISNTLKRCGWRHVKVLAEEGTAAVDVDGLVFDSGGIAKGLAVDICYRKMIEAGYKNFMVNLGGNMRASGSGRKGKAWKIGVRDPFDRNRIVGSLELTDGAAVATSGNYERFVEKDGRRYAHIIDPVSGRPVQGMAGVTVVAPTAVAADALSTALFVAGTERGAEILRKFPEVSALFVADSQPPVLQLSRGMAGRLKATDQSSVKLLGE